MTETANDQGARYFRFDIESTVMVLGERGTPCDVEGCNGRGDYLLSLELEGVCAERLACVEHVEHTANALMRESGSSVRVTFEGV